MNSVCDCFRITQSPFPLRSLNLRGNKNPPSPNRKYPLIQSPEHRLSLSELISEGNPRSKQFLTHQQRKDALNRTSVPFTLPEPKRELGSSFRSRPRLLPSSSRHLFAWSLISIVIWSCVRVSGRMAFTSIARTYANVNRDAPKSYWDYGMSHFGCRLY